jgi:hypothetical protein
MSNNTTGSFGIDSVLGAPIGAAIPTTLVTALSQTGHRVQEPYAAHPEQTAWLQGRILQSKPVSHQLCPREHIDLRDIHTIPHILLAFASAQGDVHAW